MSEKRKTTKLNAEKAEREYPGIAVDHSDDDKVDNALVKERTCTLGYNPRDAK